MAYWDVASLQADNDFAVRTTAAYAEQTLSDIHVNAPGWQAQYSWDMAAQPGFGDAYASAVAGGVPRPGQNPAVISDAQIGAAVQAVLSAPKQASP